jgi:hypothetical protein
MIRIRTRAFTRNLLCLVYLHFGHSNDMTHFQHTSPTIIAQLPEVFRTVPYSAARFPGAATDIRGGANCQLYAYAVVEHFGLAVPPVRSSELWTDTDATQRVSTPQPLDLVLFNHIPDAYGAHVGVWVGDDQVLHLCAEVGRPVVWSMAEFAARERYRVVIGIKRVVHPSQ